jgi:hypothetical protein
MAFTSRERRVEVNWHLRAGHAALGTIKGHTLDVSITGFRFSSPAPFSIGTIFEVELHVSSGVYFRAVAKIVRDCGKSVSEYSYGASFETLNEGGKQMLNQFLQTARKLEWTGV